MRLLIATVAAVGFIGAAAAVTSAPEDGGSTVSAVKEASAPSRYRVVAVGQEGTCAVTKGEALSDRLAELYVERTCSTVMPGLEQARYWREASDGSVTFAKADGGAVLEFSVADGVAYETFRPHAPLVSLVAMR
ncbi:hypothetical protein L598_001300000350 [Mesorhizobium sp. J18]|uniref:hypothetical protein n=1 Tax=Mesorhizobium sp. J18 TaxID=935263 RepID=UPI00119A9FCE|nr:hypothetical protein [Mesorhizobium sp. J18]TWG99704.1 hypothetical protein L598_001300000350 [Mesorhizobium sp. J18]